MKTIQSFLAASILAVSGVTHAATVAVLDVNEGPTSIVLDVNGPTDIVTASSGSGTATLDDSGLLTIHSILHTKTILGTDVIIHATELVNGSWNGVTFTATNGTQEITDCALGPQDLVGSSCLIGSYDPQTPVSTTVTGSFSPYSGGSIDVARTDPNSGAVTTYHYAVPQVPTPAAAWLFSSGLIGLASFARKQKTA